MLATRVSDDARARRQRRRKPFDAERFRLLFELFSFVRAASAESLHTLFFAPRGVRAFRSTTRTLARLRDAGYLTRDLIAGGRSIYHLTRKSIAVLNAGGLDVSDNLRREVPPATATYLWLRANMLAALVARGYRVGRGAEVVLPLRRYLLDLVRKPTNELDRYWHRELLRTLREKFEPQMESTCRSCNMRVVDVRMRVPWCPLCGDDRELGFVRRTYRCITCDEVVARPGVHRLRSGATCSGLVREIEAVPFDVAWQHAGRSRFDVVVLFVDNPARSLDAQLDELPIRTSNQPRVPLLVRTTDPDSLFSRARGDWATMGPRHRLLSRILRGPMIRGRATYEDRTTLVDLVPEIQAQVIR